MHYLAVINVACWLIFAAACNASPMITAAPRSVASATTLVATDYDPLPSSIIADGWRKQLDFEASRTSSWIEMRVATIDLPHVSSTVTHSGVLTALLVGDGQSVATGTANSQTTLQHSSIYLCLPVQPTMAPSPASSAVAVPTSQIIGSSFNQAAASKSVIPLVTTVAPKLYVPSGSRNQNMDGQPPPEKGGYSAPSRLDARQAFSVQEEDSMRCLYPSINSYRLLRDQEGALVLEISSQASSQYPKRAGSGLTGGAIDVDSSEQHDNLEERDLLGSWLNGMLHVRI